MAAQEAVDARADRLAAEGRALDVEARVLEVAAVADLAGGGERRRAVVAEHVEAGDADLELTVEEASLLGAKMILVRTVF